MGVLTTSADTRRGKEYNSFVQSLSLHCFHHFTGNLGWGLGSFWEVKANLRSDTEAVLLTALSDGLSAHGLGKVTGPVVELEILLFQGRVYELNLNPAI